MSDGKILFKEEKRSWVIEPSSPDVQVRLKRVFASVANTSSKIYLSDTVDVARDLEWVMQRYDFEISRADLARITELAATHRARAALVHRYLNAEHDPKPVDLAIPARRYQLIAAEMCHRFSSVLCADDLGIGKTVVGIALASMQGTRPVLVVCRPTLTSQWKHMFSRFAPKLRVHEITTTKVYEIGIVNREGKMTYPDVVIIGHSKLKSWTLELAKVKFKTIEFDEIQDFKNQDTARYRAASVLRDQAEWRLGLSATPIHNLGGEFYPVMSLLRPDELGTKDEYDREWCTSPDGRGRRAIRDPQAFGEFLRKNGMMIRRTRKEVGIELPPVTRVFHQVEHDTKALRRITKEAAELAKIILKHVQVKQGESMRAAGQFDLLVRQATGIAKAASVADFVRFLLESEEKVLLYGWHRSVYDIWTNLLSDFNPVLYTGSETTAQKDKHRDMFVKGDSRLLIMSLRAGVGIDGLQDVCHTVVTGEFDWSPAVHSQNETRIDRPGQKNPVFIYYCHALDGSDPDIVNLLRRKQEQIAGVMGDDAELFKNADHGGGHLRELARRYLKSSKEVA